MRILVTGGAGFIGGNLCRTLVDRGHDVVALDDLSSGSEANLAGLPVRLVVGSVCSAADLDTSCDGADAIVHLAAVGSVPRSVAAPMPTLRANADGTAEVLEAARRHGGLHMILAGSSSVYGANPELPKHEGLVLRPISPYAASKVAAEAFTLAWGAAYGLPVLSFRFFNVFGPLQPADHDYAAVVPRFVAAALEERPLTIYGDGRQTRDFTYVGSVVSVLTEAIERRVSDPTPVNLAFGTRVTLLDLVAELEALLGTRLDVRFEQPRTGDVVHSQAADDRLRELFPDTKPVPLAEGLAATVEWMRAQPTSAP